MKKTIGEFTIIPIASGPLETNAYLVMRGKQAIIIDAPPDVFNTLIELVEKEKVEPTHLILTHSHWDHIADAKAIQNHFHIPLLVHKSDSYNLKTPGKDRVPGWLSIPSATPDLELQGDEILTLLDFPWHVIHTPGHTPGGICLFQPDYTLLFSGDTLFRSCYGNTSLPTANPEMMMKSLRTLSHLPKTTIVFPGHGPETSIGHEKWLQRALIQDI